MDRGPMDCPRNLKSTDLNPQPAIPNPQSPIPNPQSTIRNPQSAIRNPQSDQSAIRNPQSTNILPHRVARAKMTWHGRIHFLDRSGMAPVNSLLPQPTTAAKAARPVFQFRLRTLMLVLAVCSVGFATMLYVGPLWGLSLIFLILIIGAHIAGNAIGTSLRTRAPMEAPDRGACSGFVFRRPSLTVCKTGLDWAVRLPFRPWPGPRAASCSVGSCSCNSTRDNLAPVTGCWDSPHLP